MVLTVFPVFCLSTVQQVDVLWIIIINREAVHDSWITIFLFLYSVVDDEDTASSSIRSTAGKSNALLDQSEVCFLNLPSSGHSLWKFTDVLPEGLVRELPAADLYPEPPAAASSSAIDDDLEELQRQLDALNSS